jgi:hypothetical protein
VIARWPLALLACVSLTAVACGGEPETSRQATTGFEVEQSTGSEQVEQTSSDECPPDWPGPWTACPEADWVQKVAQRAGYRVAGETGSALIAKRNGRSFYIWATEGTPEELDKAAKRESRQPLGVVEGVEVYGDESLWRWWVAEGFVIWLQAGPTADSRLPSLTEMESLVRASKTVPRPS